jgi:hypothetical protein
MKKLTILLAALLCFAGYSKAQNFYQPTWWRGHVYVPVPENTLEVQRQVALELRGHLVFVDDSDERNFLHTNIVCRVANNSSDNGYWFTGHTGRFDSWGWHTDRGVLSDWLNWTGINNYWSITQYNPWPEDYGDYVCMFKQAAFYRARIYTTRFIHFPANTVNTYRFKAIVEIE